MSCVLYCSDPEPWLLPGEKFTAQYYDPRSDKKWESLLTDPTTSYRPGKFIIRLLSCLVKLLDIMIISNDATVIYGQKPISCSL